MKNILFGIKMALMITALILQLCRLEGIAIILLWAYIVIVNWEKLNESKY